MSINYLSLREELEIGLMVADSLVNFVRKGVISTSEIRSALRDVVKEVGSTHPDDYLVELTVNRVRHDLAGRV